MKPKKPIGAPVRPDVACLSLAGILLLAGIVCLLHGVNAVSLRGRMPISGTAWVSANEALVPVVEQIDVQGKHLHIAGLLLRPGQKIARADVRVGLIPYDGDDMGQEILLLNTQMVRRSELAPAEDDHCGFHAAARLADLAEGAYAVVLADGQAGNARLLETGWRLTLEKGKVTAQREEQLDEETKH